LAQAAHALSAHATVVAIAGDVSDPEHRSRLVAAASELGGLDLLVNNASVLGPSPQPSLAEYPLDVLTRVFAVNVTGPLGMIQEALPLLRASGGTIVNVTSDAAIESYEGWGGYGSSKAALEQLSNILSAEEPAVTVIWFDPGDMNTVLHQEAFPGEDISDRPPPEASVPPLLRILETTRPSGRYQASAEEDRS
jgi:NAD(P)-dependent dehydrogenase (short-subunit alcohol dehydrogenase family)